jgi:FtsP/CotA-like multicopper oxidase with cupredoxin domain
MACVGRRDLLVAAASAALGAVVRGEEARAHAGHTHEPGSAAAPGAIVLEARMMDTVLDGVRARLRTYNGQLPGPVIKVAAGETLRIRLNNSLPPYDSAGWDGNHNVPHALDTTNLHFHGLDVMPHLFDPIGTSDPAAPMLAIGPGQHFDYEMAIPQDQPAGLHWYHPHYHGSTAVQAVSGMAGGIIVTGPIDEVPEIKAAREFPLVVQDIGLFPSEDEPGLWTYEPKQNAVWHTFGSGVARYNPATGRQEPTQPALNGGFTTGDYRLRFYLLNGTPFFKETHNEGGRESCTMANFEPPQCPIPTQLAAQRIEVAPGEVVRFRMLNGCSDNYMPILVEGHDLHLIAMDGRNFPEVRTQPARLLSDGVGQVALAPGNRAEFLIKAAARPGTYRIVQVAHGQGFLASVEKVIAEIVVAGEPREMSLPRALPVNRRDYPLIKPEEVKVRRTFQFATNFPPTLNPAIGVDFPMNNAIYRHDEVPTVVRLDEPEEWRIVVGSVTQGGTEGHPFHVHVTAFEVISIGDVVQPPGLIQDTIWVPANTTVTVRVRFREWTGKSVLHCHILPHEDTGMMQNFIITSSGTPQAPQAPHGAARAHHR